jgi:hypothetical protein
VKVSDGRLAPARSAGRRSFSRRRHEVAPALRPGPTVLTRLVPALVAFATTFGMACARSDGAPRADTPIANVAPRIVDSVRSLDEDLRRFRADISRVPDRLRGGGRSREALVRRFMGALARSDTALLEEMAMTRAEFAYLTYPSSPYTRAPYRQSPEIVWLLLRAEHEKGLGRLIQRLGGQQVEYLGHECESAPLQEGENRLWRGCRVRMSVGSDAPRERRLFGVIVERHGEFKFVNYRTEF